MHIEIILKNPYGAEIFTRQTLSWADLDRHWFAADASDTQIICGYHMHLIRAVYESGSTYPMHFHPHEQFSLLLTGRILLTVGDETREIGPGDGWYAAGNVPHGGQIIGDETAVFVDVYSPATRWILDILDTGKKLPPIGSVD